jgi:hypothetical protein
VQEEMHANPALVVSLNVDLRCTPSLTCWCDWQRFTLAASLTHLQAVRKQVIGGCGFSRLSVFVLDPLCLQRADGYAWL